MKKFVEARVTCPREDEEEEEEEEEEPATTENTLQVSTISCWRFRLSPSNRIERNF